MLTLYYRLTGISSCDLEGNTLGEQVLSAKDIQGRSAHEYSSLPDFKALQFKLVDRQFSHSRALTYRCHILVFDHAAFAVAASFLVFVLLPAVGRLFTG